MANVALRAKADKIILGGMGLSNDDFLYFKQVFENAGALDRIVSFVNTTENPPVERLLVPDMALTAAEYFAVDKGEKVLVLLTDMTLTPMRWPSYRTVWIRFLRRTRCRVRSTPTWRRSTRRPCSCPTAARSPSSR